MPRNALWSPLSLVGAVLTFSLIGCGGATPSKCVADTECLNGHVCESGTCMTKITVDAGRPDAGAADAGGGDCTPGSVCRVRNGDCDVADLCPASGVCPSDSVVATGTICRAPASDCDAAERCDGTSPTCPADAVTAQGTVCRAVSGTCDVEEVCNGTGATCPADQFVSTGMPCRASAGNCDVEEACTGASAACPPDGKRAPGFSCRPAVSSCDAEEVCDGMITNCPADAVQPGTMQCAPQSCTAGVTTPARFCAGGSATCNASATPIPCNGYQCSGQTCRSSCTTTADCLSTHFCQPGGLCAPKRVDGQQCTSAASGEECVSGSCTATYADNDGDGIGAGTAAFSCGTMASSGRALTNTDCCDTDARAFPGATAYQTTARVACGGFDFNCDGQSSLEFIQTNACQSSACGVSCVGNPGWAGVNPACGTVATYVTNCATQLCLPGTSTRCSAIIEQRTQSCR